MYGLSKLAQPLARQSLQVMSKRTNIAVNGPPQVRMAKWVTIFTNVSSYL